jgi:predicted AlkP superfamily pyrophosphatase or phosphodiesterase
MKLKYLWCVLCLQSLAAAAQVRLGVVIVVDQLSAESFRELAPHSTAGIARLRQEGTVFFQTVFRAAPTVTSVGHATLATGTYAASHGIVGNDWFDAAGDFSRQSTEDKNYTIVGRAPSATDATAATFLKVPTLSETVKAHRAQAKSVVISGKDRSAILTAGKSADAAIWFDSKQPLFVTSTAYAPTLPTWLTALNLKVSAAYEKIPKAEMAKGQEESAAEDMAFQASIDAFEVDVALEAVDAFELGKDDIVDLLSISFSGHDRIGHHFGPDSAESHASFASIDKQLGRLFAALDKKVGKNRYVVGFSADHGVGKKAEVLQSRGIDAGRIDIKSLRERLEAALDGKMQPADWIIGFKTPGFALNRKLRAQLTPAAVEALKLAALQEPGVSELLTLSEVLEGKHQGSYAQALRRGAFEGRSPDLFVIPRPFWMYGKSEAAAHATAYSYDSAVPMLFWGPGVGKAKLGEAEAIDFAPTMAFLLGVPTPAGASGHVALPAR